MNGKEDKDVIVETEWTEPTTIVETEWAEPIIDGQKKKTKISPTTSTKQLDFYTPPTKIQEPVASPFGEKQEKPVSEAQSTTSTEVVPSPITQSPDSPFHKVENFISEGAKLLLVKHGEINKLEGELSRPDLPEEARVMISEQYNRQVDDYNKLSNKVNEVSDGWEKIKSQDRFKDLVKKYDKEYQEKAKEGTIGGAIWNSLAEGYTKTVDATANTTGMLMAYIYPEITGAADKDDAQKNISVAMEQMGIKPILDKQLKSKSTTQEYTQALKEKSILAEGGLGLAESVFPMITPKMSGMFAIGFSDAVKEINETKTDISVDATMLYGASQGAVQLALEKFGLSRVVQNKSILKGLTNRVVRNLLTEGGKKITGNVVLRTASNIVSGASAEFETGAGQYIAEEGLRQISDLFSGHDDFKFEGAKDFIAGTLKAGITEAIGGGIMATAIHSADLIKSPKNKEAAEKMVQTIRDIKENIDNEVVSDEAKAAMSQTAKNISERILESAQEDIAKIEGLSEEGKAMVSEVDKAIAQKQTVLEDINVSETVKEVVKKEMDELNKNREEIIQANPKLKADELEEAFKQKEAAKGKAEEVKVGEEAASTMEKETAPTGLSEEQIAAREEFVKVQVQEIVDSGELSSSVPIEHYENYFRNKYNQRLVKKPKLSENEQQAEKFGSLSEAESSGIEPTITALEGAGTNAERISTEEIERNLEEADKLLGAKPTTYTSENIETISGAGKTPLHKKVLGDVKNIVTAVSNIVKAQGKKLSVNIHESEESYAKAVEAAGGSRQDASTKGFYMADDGSIHLNMNRVTSNTMLHEGFHPVLDFMEKNNPDTVQELFEQLRGVKGAEKFVAYGEQYEGDVTKMKESITEFIASVADGTVKVDATTFEKIKNYIVGALNTLGFKLSKQQLLDLKDAKGLKNLANLISEKFKKGEEIKVEEAIEKVSPKETVEYVGEEFPYKKSEAPVAKRKKISEVYEQKHIDFANEMIDTGLFNSVGQILDWRPELGLSTAEVTKGIKDIKAGKNSAPARKVIEATKDMLDKGTIPMIIGRGGVMDKMGITIEDWREEVKNNSMPKELSADEVIKAKRIKTEEIINKEGITKENFETILKDVDWLYSPEEIKNIKTYLDETTKPETRGAPEVKATEVERKPLDETKGKIQPQKEEIKSPELKDFLVAYAPMRKGEITDISRGSEGFNDKKYKQWKQMAKQFASDLGIEITEDNNSIGVYGATSDLPEVSSVVTIKATGEKAKLFGALMGSLAPQGQHSVALLEYAEDGAAVEHRFTFDDKKIAENFVSNITGYGLESVSLLPDSNVVIIIDEGSFNVNKFENDYGKHITRVEARNAHNSSIQQEDYLGIIQSARDSEQGYDTGELGANLSDVLKLAKTRAGRLSRDYGEKSKQAKERADEGVKDYIAKNKVAFNLPEPAETKVERVDNVGQKQIHDAYEKAPVDDSKNPEVKKAYEQAGKEINAQFEYLTKVLKVKIEFQGADPYENSATMFDDIINNNTLKIFQGGEDHAFLGEQSKDASGLTLNEKLRAVHDYFGHFVNRNQFGQIGEESAWVDHSKMFSPEAQRAISTETRGQNSFVHQTEVNKKALENFKNGRDLISEGKVAEGNKLIREGQAIFQYAPQKVALLPKELTDWTKYKTEGEKTKPSFQREEPKREVLQFAKPLKTESEANKVTDEKAKQRASFSKINPQLELKEENWFDKLATAVQNRFRRLGQLQTAAQKAGIDIIDRIDAEMANELLVGRAKAKIDRMEGEVVKSKPNQAPSLFERMGRDKVGVEDLGLYMYAKHAPERNAKVASDRRAEFNEELAKINEKRAELNQITDANLKATRAAKLDAKEKELQKILMDDGGSGMTNQQSADILAAFDADGKTAKLDEYAKEFREKVIKPNLDNMLEGDLISQEQYDELSNQFADYVPLLVGEKMEGKIVGKGKSVDLRGKDIYRAKGSNLYGVNERVNPVVAAMFNYQKGVIRAEKNKANKAFLNLAEEVGEPMFKIRRPEYSVKLNSNGEVEYAYRNYDPVTSDNTVELKIDGKPVLIEVADEALLNAMKGMGVTRAIPLLNSVNSWLRNVNTIYNPEFMVSNFIRDVQTAVGNISAENIKNIEAKMLKNIPMAMKGIWQNERGTKSEWADIIQELKDEGGDISWIQVGDINEYSKTLDSQIRKYNSNKTADKFSKVLSGVLNYYKAASKVAEMASRVAAYKAAIDSGVSKAKAAQLAKNLTVNFEKKGNLGATMDSLYLFANAGIQGTARMFTALGKSKKARAIAGSAIAGSLIMNILNGLINDDEYDKIDDGIKERNLIIMHSDGSYTKIPLPYGFNIFKVMGDAIYEVTTGKRRVGETLGKVGLSVANAFNPLSSATLNQMLSPTVTDPFVQLSENKNWRGSPIVPESKGFQPQKKESSKYFSTVRPITKTITDALNDVTGGTQLKAGYVDISPEVIDHFIDYLGGGTARFTMNVFNDTYELTKGEIPNVSNIPFARTFVGKPSDYRDTKIVYEMADEAWKKEFTEKEVERFKKSLRSAAKEGRFEDVESFNRVAKQFANGQEFIKLSKKYPDKNLEELKKIASEK